MEVNRPPQGSHGGYRRGRSPAHWVSLLAGLVFLMVGIAVFVPALAINDNILWFSDFHYAFHVLIGAVGVALIVLSAPRNRRVSKEHDPTAGDNGESSGQRAGTQPT